MSSCPAGFLYIIAAPYYVSSDGNGTERAVWETGQDIK